MRYFAFLFCLFALGVCLVEADVAGVVLSSLCVAINLCVIWARGCRKCGWWLTYHYDHRSYDTHLRKYRNAKIRACPRCDEKTPIITWLEERGRE